MNSQHPIIFFLHHEINRKKEICLILIWSKIQPDQETTHVKKMSVAEMGCQDGCVVKIANIESEMSAFGRI